MTIMGHMPPQAGARRADLSGEAVRSFCRPLIADYKLPELFAISSEPLLRNQNGKFDKPALRALAAQSLSPAPGRTLDRSTQ